LVLQKVLDILQGLLEIMNNTVMKKAKPKPLIERKGKRQDMVESSSG
jgi:hypothetical protein